jgi:16S rRNA (uracil1498-N3)-methyltransferase
VSGGASAVPAFGDCRSWREDRVFYLPPGLWNEPYVLSGKEARHASRVLRLRAGDTLYLIDGQGREGRFRIRSIRSQELLLEAGAIRTHPCPPCRPVLAAAWTKAARRGWILEKAVEFDAAAIWLWQAERSQFPVPADVGANWQGQLVAGAKQCGNLWLPEVRTMPRGLEELLAASAGFAHRFALLEVDHQPAGFMDPSLPGQADTLYVVGPEGGFTPHEAQRLLDAGFAGVSLGNRVLRWETAAMLCLGLHWWKSRIPATDGQASVSGCASP